MKHRRLREALRTTPAPGEQEAADRARAVLLRAYSAAPADHPAPACAVAALALATCLLVAAAIVTPPGLAVSRHLLHSIRATIAVQPEGRHATLTARLPLPAGCCSPATARPGSCTPTARHRLTPPATPPGRRTASSS